MSRLFFLRSIFSQVPNTKFWMDEIEKLKQIIKEHEIRIAKLENQVKPKKSSKQKLSPKNSPNNYEGIEGAIRLLINDKFFDNPQSLREVIKEMKRKGFDYDQPSINNTIKNIFLDNGVLQKIPEDTKWKYVVIT